MDLDLKKLLQKKDLNNRKWSLLYRGSRDGFEASYFHSRCDGLPNTLTIVKSTNGNIFGGYTTIPWESIKYDKDNGYMYDFCAFLFSLVNNENIPLIFEHTKEPEYIKGENIVWGSVWPDSNSGPIFGGGHDLRIGDYSNTDYSCGSKLGFTYTHRDFQSDSERANSILAGFHLFKVDEIEVFQLEE